MNEFLLLEGDVQAGADALLLEGPLQLNEPFRLAMEADGSGVILLEGDAAPGGLGLSGDAVGLFKLVLEPVT